MMASLLGEFAYGPFVSVAVSRQDMKIKIWKMLFKAPDPPKFYLNISVLLNL